MKKLFYPAIFHIAEEGGYWITFPDMPECFTQGDTMEEAYEMAVDALGLALFPLLENKENVPTPSSPSDIVVEDGFLVVVEFDIDAYRKKYSSKAIKKTLTIPEWLNEAAIAMEINFSQVLQEALIAKLDNARISR